MKKYFIYGLIISIVIAGLLSIGVLLSGKFDELQIKILFTTLAFTVYSIIGLCCNSIVEGKYSVFGRLGLGVTFIGLLYAVVTTWATPKAGEFLQFRFSLLVIGLCFAHCSLMLLVNTYNSTISAARAISMSASVIAALIVVAMISSLDLNAGTFKLLGVVSIVGVIATIIAPILAFTANKSNHTDGENSAGV
ncbi:hypothetical protein OAG1_12080 [Agarivorans sp. OAG1]|uniref:hypothetical protein n=1 Tax=Agarivorans sp. OAG1 TaxID=3082387 RepID=UPI002B2B2202|nr:hypothetical protein OAG1_12080 [Agarivorans sp. OAG1]